jgi:DNA-binding MarR family transcriptional regulator
MTGVRGVIMVTMIAEDTKMGSSLNQMTAALLALWQKDHDMTVSDLLVLFSIADNPGINSSQINEKTGIEKSSVSRIIKTLDLEFGWITRHNSIDERQKNLNLTPDGEKIVRYIKRQIS